VRRYCVGLGWSVLGAAASSKGDLLTGVEGLAICSRVGSDDSFGRNRPLASRRFFESFRPGILLHRETFVGLLYNTALIPCAKIAW
jgi:hypothetical protein